MPLVTFTLAAPASAQRKAGILDAVHAALVSTGVPAADRFQRVLVLDPDDVRFDARYPDLERDRGDGFVLIEILRSAGRSVKIKRQLLDTLMASLSRQGPDSERVMVCFKDTAWENWSFGGGRRLHA